ncbi:MAG: MotA/TolQ/ExbB proton channel family protein [Sphaerochaetaceae bacterium]|jgi:biopolymer transport protein ExbB
MEDTLTLYSLFCLGGSIMWPLLLMLIAITVIIIERTITFSRMDRDVEDGCLHARYILENQGLPQVYRFCRNDRFIWGKALALAFSPPEERDDGRIATESRQATALMERSLALLDTLATLAPVLGFLGTVTGMIATFKSIALANAVELQLVASGLYEALITTAFGLIISAIATLASHFFWQMTDRFERELGHAVSLAKADMQAVLHEKT